MHTLPAAWLLGILLAQSAEPLPGLTPLGDLLNRLAADDPAIREKAQAELPLLPLTALPSLQAARKHPDPEVRRHLGEAIQILLNRQQHERTLVTKSVRLRFANVRLEEVIAATAEQTGIPMQLPDLSAERREQRLTLDTGETTPWEALQRVLTAAKLHVEPPTEIAPATPEDEPLRARARFRWARRGRSSLPRIEPSPLRLLDEAEPEGIVRWVQGPLCIEAGPVPGVRVVRPEPRRELTLPLTFQLEPRFAFRGIAAVLFDEVRDEYDQALSAPLRVHDRTFELDSFTIPRYLDSDQLGRWWYRRHLTFPIRTLGKPSHLLSKVRGRVLLGLRGPTEDLGRVVLRPGALPAESAPTLDGGQLRVTKVENDGDGTWSVEMTLSHPEQGSWVGIGIDTLLSREGNCPVRLMDRKGGEIRLAGGLIDNRNAHLSLIRVNFVATVEQDGPATLIYSGRRPVELEVPFELRNVPLP